MYAAATAAAQFETLVSQFGGAREKARWARLRPLVCVVGVAGGPDATPAAGAQPAAQPAAPAAAGWVAVDAAAADADRWQAEDARAKPCGAGMPSGVSTNGGDRGAAAACSGGKVLAAEAAADAVQPAATRSDEAPPGDAAGGPRPAAGSAEGDSPPAVGWRTDWAIEALLTPPAVDAGPANRRGSLKAYSPAASLQGDSASSGSDGFAPADGAGSDSLVRHQNSTFGMTAAAGIGCGVPAKHDSARSADPPGRRLPQLATAVHVAASRVAPVQHMSDEVKAVLAVGDAVQVRGID